MFMHPELVITGSRVLLGDSAEAGPGYLLIDRNTGKIKETEPRIADAAEFPDAEFVDAGEKYVFPGLIDAHVHLNEPGRTDWEGFHTGTTAAASGGITLVAEMPLNSIPSTTTVENLEIKRNAAKGQLGCDVVFWGGVVPDNADHLIPLSKAGVRGFKCFLCESGVDEFPGIEEHHAVTAAKQIVQSGSRFLFHAEFDKNHNKSCCLGCSATSTSSYKEFLETRPDEFEVDAVAIIERLLNANPTLKAHIVHVSSVQVLPKTSSMRKKFNLSLETCVHYLVLDADKVPDGDTLYKCAPPIRDKANQERLWEALFNGEIDFIVSDHSPSTRIMKKLDEGDFMQAWGGISTLGLGLSLVWTEARKRHASPRQIVDWMSRKPAEFVQVADHKGSLKPGCDGDVCIFDPSVNWTISENDLNFKNRISPYVGVNVDGVVEATYLRGTKIYTRGESVKIHGKPY